MIEVERGILPTTFSVHPFFLENFIIVFDTHATKDRIL